MSHPKHRCRQKPTIYKILAFAIAFLLSAVPVHATREPGPYLTLTGSINKNDDMVLTNQEAWLPDLITATGASLQTKIGLGFNHSIGYQFRNPFSTELEFSYKGGQFGPGLNGDITSKSFLVNGIYSFNIRKFYSPYIGYGIGLAHHEASIKDSGDRADRTLAYQVKIGVDMELSRKLSLLLGYRYFTTNDPQFNGYFIGEMTSHGIDAGIKLHF